MSASSMTSLTTWKLPDASVPGNIIILVTSLLGTILNFHLLCAYYRNKNRLTVNQYPLVNMTVGDFGLAASCTLVFALHLMYRDIDMTWCQVNGFTNVFFAGQSVLSCALLAVERYFLIVHYHSITRRQVFLFSLGIWFSSTAVALIPIIFKTNNYPKISGIYCLSDNTSQFVFNRVYAIGCLTILLTGMIFLSLSYLLLYKKATKIGFKWVSVVSINLILRGRISCLDKFYSLQENLKAAAETDIECTKNEAKIAQMEFTKKLVLIIITFCVCK
ncbi:hypothetical protein BKA69DRAFT_1092830 [Paraphysoderma sedebokerense]|nr:hypothetical protein BKA69DRAFT_1092830 [Paraphysoderma sedebokerense]